MIKRISWMILLAPLLAVTGCEGGRESPPPTRLEVVHAAPSEGSLLFLRVESLFAELAYRGQQTRTIDEDTYRFNIETIPPAASESLRVMSFERQLLHGTDYTFVLTEIDNLLDVLIVERPTHPSGATSSSALAVHAGPDLPPLTMYVVPQGTSHETASPLGTVAFTETSQSAPLPAGTYEVILTAADDPSDIRLHSPSFTVENQRANLFVIFSEANQGIADMSVMRLHVQSQFLLDRGMPSVTRVLNASADRQPRDIYVGEELGEPLIAAAEYGVPTDYATTPIGELVYTITPQDNVGALELQYVGPTTVGRMHTLLISGQPGEGELSAALVTDDRRRILDRGRVRLANATNQFTESLNYYLVPAGTETDSLGNAITLSSPGFSQINSYAPGEYELYVRPSGDTENFVAGPIAISIEAGEVYTLFVLDGETSSEASVLLLN